MKHGRPAVFFARRHALWAVLPVALRLFLPVSAASAQTAGLPPNPVPVPRVAAPAMQAPLSLPTVTAPVLSAPAAQPGTAAAAASRGTAQAGTAKAAESAAAAGAASGNSSLPESLDEMTSPLSLLEALSGSGTDGEGLDAVSALLGGATGLSALTGTASAGDTSSDSVALAKILALLEKRQAESAAAQKAAGSAATPAAPPAAAGAPVTRPKTASGGEIVRFIVNRTDIAATATGVVSSALAKDGSFLITGRRPALGELFYLVCRKTGAGTYRLYADIGQDYPNEKSWLYQLARKTPFDGTLTGDLLVFRSGDPAWALDLVIRVITPTVPASTVR